MNVIFILFLSFQLTLSQTNYKIKSFSHFQEERLKRFYLKAFDITSKNKIYPAKNKVGLGGYALQDLPYNSPLVEVISDYTISSFDSFFKDGNKIRESISDEHYSNQEKEMIILCFNILAIRHIKDVEKSRFVKIFLDNQPKFFQFTPLWENDQVTIFQKFWNTTEINYNFFNLDNSIFTFFLHYLMDLHNNKITSYDDMLKFDEIKFAMNTAYTRSIPISLENWKTFRGSDTLSGEDKYHGVIILPGMDALNHEYRESDIKIEMKKEKLILRSQRKFIKDEEVKIKYVLMTISEQFRKYGFISLDFFRPTSLPYSLDPYNKNSFEDSSKKEQNQEELALKFSAFCRLIGVCSTPNMEINPNITIFGFNHVKTYQIDSDYFKFLLKNWQEEEFTIKNIEELVNRIKNNEFSRLTVALALNEILKPIVKNLDAGNNFVPIKKSIELITSVEENFDVDKFLKELGLNIQKAKLPFDNHLKIEESIKFSLFQHHKNIKKFGEIVYDYQKVMDNLLSDLKEKISDKVIL